MTISELTMNSARTAAVALTLGLEIEEVSRDGVFRFQSSRLIPTVRLFRREIILALVADSLEKAHAAAVELIARDGLAISPIELLEECRKEVASVVNASSAYILRLAPALQRHERLDRLAIQQCIGGE